MSIDFGRSWSHKPEVVCSTWGSQLGAAASNWTLSVAFVLLSFNVCAASHWLFRAMILISHGSCSVVESVEGIHNLGVCIQTGFGSTMCWSEASDAEGKLRGLQINKQVYSRPAKALMQPEWSPLTGRMWTGNSSR